MGLDDRDYTKRSSSSHSSNHKQNKNSQNSGYVDVETFVQASYVEAVKERDAGFFTKLKNKLFRLFKR
jgi:phosphate starvation-inducible protein PhoH